MAGLDPAIHVFVNTLKKDVDTRDKPGHDGRQFGAIELADLRICSY